MTSRHSQTQNELLLTNLLDFYKKEGAKSLGIEWVKKEFWPIIASFSSLSDADKMATLSEHIALQIATILNINNIENVLVTGGGTFNHFLINNIKSKSDCRDFISGPNYVNWKLDRENIIQRFYYIHDYKSIQELAKNINVKYTISWEQQNWFILFTKE